MPGFGAHFEYPWRDFNIEAEAYGIYANVGSFEGYAVRGSLDGVWRFHENLGLVVGYRFLRADIEVNSFDTDFWIHGPSIGIEAKF